MDDFYDCWINGGDYKSDFIESYHCIENYMRLEFVSFRFFYFILQFIKNQKHKH